MANKKVNDKLANSGADSQNSSADTETHAPLPNVPVSIPLMQEADSADEYYATPPKKSGKRQVKSKKAPLPNSDVDLTALTGNLTDNLTDNLSDKTMVMGAIKPQNASTNSDAQFTNSFAITSVSPISAAKTGFVLSFFAGIIVVIGVLALYLLLLFTGIIAKLGGETEGAGYVSTSFNFANLFDFGTVFLILAVLAILITIAGTLFSWVFALLYNFSVRFFGGISVNLRRVTVTEQKQKQSMLKKIKS
jgi:hypothetical protein